MEDKHKLFVGSLPPDITDEEITAAFGAYGTVIEHHLMRGKSTSGQACAFVVLDSKASGDNAIASMDNAYALREGGTPIRVSWAKKPGYGGGGGFGGCGGYGCGGCGGCGCGGYGCGGYGGGCGNYGGCGNFGGGCGWGGCGGCGGCGNYGGCGKGQWQGGGGGAPAGPKSKLFVGNLPPDITQEVISQVFGTYGTVTNVHIMAGKAKSGQSCAFVEYSTPTEAETAVLTLHEKYEIRPGDGHIAVKFANSGNRPGPY